MPLWLLSMLAWAMAPLPLMCTACLSLMVLAWGFLPSDLSVPAVDVHLSVVGLLSASTVESDVVQSAVQDDVRVEAAVGNEGDLVGMVLADAEAVEANETASPPVLQESASAILPLVSSLLGSPLSYSGRQSWRVPLPGRAVIVAAARYATWR